MLRKDGLVVLVGLIFLSLLWIVSIYRRNGRFFQELTLECGWLFPFEGVCVVCDRSTKLTFDEQFRLHADEGSAIEFSDGFCTYARHGKLVTETDKSTDDKDMS